MGLNDSSWLPTISENDNVQAIVACICIMDQATHMTSRVIDYVHCYYKRIVSYGQLKFPIFAITEDFDRQNRFTNLQ